MSVDRPKTKNPKKVAKARGSVAAELAAPNSPKLVATARESVAAEIGDAGDGLMDALQASANLAMTKNGAVGFIPRVAPQSRKRELTEQDFLPLVSRESNP